MFTLYFFHYTFFSIYIIQYYASNSPAITFKLDKITMGIVQKIIKMPVLQLKAACKRGEADQLVDVINEIFDLEKQNESAYSH